MSFTYIYFMFLKFNKKNKMPYNYKINYLILLKESPY